MSETLREKIERIRNEKKITTNNELLMRIYCYIYKSSRLDEAQEWAKGYKANFSKILDEERKMPLDILVGLEHVLETTADYIYYGVEPNVKFIPHGLEYAAALDRTEVYEQLNGEMYENSKVISSFNEYGKTIVDYIVKYKAINGIKFLSDTYGYYYDPNRESFWTNDRTFFCTPKGSTPNEIANIIASKGNADLFFKVFNTIDDVKNFHRDNSNSLYYEYSFWRLIYENDDLFNEMFKELNVNIKEMNHLSYCSFGFENNNFVDSILEEMIDSMINDAFWYQRETGKKYDYSKVIKIAKYGIEHNKKQVELLRSHIGQIKGEITIDSDSFIKIDEIRVGNIVDNRYAEQYSEYEPEELKALLKELSTFRSIIINLPKDELIRKASLENKDGIDFETFAGYLLRNTEIGRQYRNDKWVLESINETINHFNKPDFKKNLSKKLMDTYNMMLKALNENKNHYENEMDEFYREYIEITLAKSFIELHEKELNSL